MTVSTFGLVICWAYLVSSCMATVQREPAKKDMIRVMQKPEKSLHAPKLADSQTIKWQMPASTLEYIFVGMGTFNTWSEECKKLAPEMRPLTLDVNFSKDVAKHLLSAAEGSVFDSEEVLGPEIIEGRMIAYKLSKLGAKPCEAYPRNKDGGRLPAFFVPITTVQRGDLKESDLLRRAYTCQLAARVDFPVPIVCVGPKQTDIKNN